MMLLHLSRKMLSFLSARGVEEAKKVLWDFGSGVKTSFENTEINRPTAKFLINDYKSISYQAFEIASSYLSDNEIALRLTKWLQEEKACSLISTIDRPDTSVREIINAITRYRNIIGDSSMLYSPTEHWLIVALIRVFLSDKLEFINKTRQYFEIKDFYYIIDRLIYPRESHGKIGGKAAGLFTAHKILQKAGENNPELASIKVPKTWYITTDEIKEFLHYNDLEELNVQKYKELYEIRHDYPNVIQIMKNSRFPENISKNLAMVIDETRDTPLIVRSSSILEDQSGAAFSGKYKSLFLANQGNRQECLEALQDAIIEVYASMYNPDSIQYRAERGLLDFREEMGIMIQEVVGKRYGDYFLPLYAGVAFSNNDYLWSPRLERESGLVRMVMGLGSRAVDRVGGDFPVLFSPGQPDLKVNTVPEEIARYSPGQIDLINLKKNTFETLDLNSFLKKQGGSIKGIDKAVSRYNDDYIEETNAFNIDFEKDRLLLTFDGLINKTAFPKKINLILKTLKGSLDTEVDIEFASDGEDFYLLQCRPQIYLSENTPAAVPKNIDKRDIIFSAERHITNGEISDISYIVYVDPENYGALADYDQLLDVGRVVGKLNSLLPPRKFVLMGPGRWGSRGDIKMGVRVSYADISNTAVLIEIARKKSDYVPELSFGTHFFLDLVETGIKYLPLYPDEKGIIYNERFLKGSENILPRLLSEYSHLEDIIRVVNIPEISGGKTLSVSMNAELGEALGYLSEPSNSQVCGVKELSSRQQKVLRDRKAPLDDRFWRWRYYMAERLADSLDFDELGIKGIYIFGSSNTGTAGPGSDIDLLIHFEGSTAQKQKLMDILQGWSVSLAEMNYMKTGYRSEGLLDVHLISDKDIEARSSFAARIGAVSNPATPIKLKKT